MRRDLCEARRADRIAEGVVEELREGEAGRVGVHRVRAVGRAHDAHHLAAPWPLERVARAYRVTSQRRVGSAVGALIEGDDSTSGPMMRAPKPAKAPKDEELAHGRLDVTADLQLSAAPREIEVALSVSLPQHL